LLRGRSSTITKAATYLEAVRRAGIYNCSSASTVKKVGVIGRVEYSQRKKEKYFLGYIKVFTS